MSSSSSIPLLQHQIPNPNIRSISPTPLAPVPLASELNLADTLQHHHDQHQSNKQSNTNNSSSHDQREPYDDYKSHPTPWTLVICLFMVYFLMSGIENGVAPCIITTLETQYNLTTTTVTAAQSMTEVTKIVASLGVGHFANKAKILFVCFGAIVWAAGSALFGGVAHESMLFLSFAIMGLGYSVPSVLCPSILEDCLAAAKEKGRIPFLLGIIYTGASIGVAVGFLVCGFTLDDESEDGGTLWRWNFFIAAALVGVPLILLGKFVIQDTCSSRAKIAEEVKKSLDPDLPLWATIKILLKNRIFVGMSFCLTTQLAYINAFIALLPKYIEEGLEQSKSTASFVLAATVPAAVLGTFLGGYLCKRFKFGLRGQLKFCLITNLIVVPMIFIFLSDNFILVVVTLVLAMFFVFLNASPSLTLIALALDDRRQVAYANAVVNIVIRLLGGIPGPIILGLLIDNASSNFPFRWAYLTVGLVCAVLTVIGVVFAMWGAPDKKSFGEQRQDDENNNNNNNKSREGDDEMNNIVISNSGSNRKKQNSNNNSGSGGGGEVVVIFDPPSPTATKNTQNQNQTPQPPSSSSSSHLRSKSISPPPAPLPRIQVTNPSASPDRAISSSSSLSSPFLLNNTSTINTKNNSFVNRSPSPMSCSGSNGSTAQPIFSQQQQQQPSFLNEWAHQDLLKAPENTFLSPEAQEAEKEYYAELEEQKEQQQQQNSNVNPIDDFDFL